MFSIGALLALHNIEPPRTSNKWLVIMLLILWPVLATLYDYELSPGGIFRESLFNLQMITGILGLWLAYDFINESFIDKLTASKIAEFSFLIYLLQEPLLTYLIQITAHLVPNSTLTSCLMYICMPIITVLLCCYIAQLLKKGIPRVYNLISGNR